MKTPQVGSRFDLHGVRYAVGPLAPCGRPWAVNEASGLGLHVIAPTYGPDAASLADATSIDGPTPEGYLVATATPRGLDDDLLRGRALAHAGLRQAAAACFYRSLGRVPANTEALIGLARIELAEGRREPAAELALRALAAEPHLADYYDVYLRGADDAPRRFLNQYERGGAFIGPRHDHDLAAARAFLRLGHPERAQALLSAYPSTPPALLAEVEKGMRASRRAHELTAQARLLVNDDDRREDMAALLARAHAAYPPDIPSALNLGFTLHHLNRHAEALAVLQPLAERLVMRDLPVLLANIGFAAAAAGNLPLALRSLAGAWSALEAVTQQHPQSRLELAPCVAKWADAEERIESSPRVPLEVLGRLQQACESTGLQLPEEVNALAALYQQALRTPVAWGTPQTATPRELVPPDAPREGDWTPDTRVLDELLVERRLGDGQRGTLYSVVHGPSGTRMTVERIRAVTAEERRDLWNGLRVWCNLPVHDNLLACRSFVSSGDEVLVLFEEVEPLTLDAYLQQFDTPALQPQAAAHLVAFAVHLAWVLDLAHGSGVTHGPIPLRCIHFTLSRTVKVGGFWHGDQLGEEEAVRRHISAVLAPDDNPLMRALHEDTLRSHVPLPRAGADPSPWSPPESVEGRGASEQSDAWHWALAVLQAASICYGIAAQENVSALLAALVDSPHVGNLPTQLPAELVTILKRCLEPDPADRPRRLSEVAEALQVVYGPHFRQEPPSLSGGQQGARALESLTQQEKPDPHDAAADLPWKDPRLALSIAYQAAGLDPLAPQPYLPQGDASEQGRTLAHLAALEVASSLLRERLAATPTLVPELARQRFDASMMLGSLGDFRGALQQSGEAVSLLRQCLERKSITALRWFLITVTGERGAYHAALGEVKEAVEAVREADRLARETPSSAETHAIEANVRMRLATVARRFPQTLDIALACLERALKIWRDQENLEYLGYTQATIGQVHAARGDADGALTAWERAVPLLTPFADKRAGPGTRLLATGYLQLVGLHQRAGRLEEADATTQRALDLLARRVEKEGMADLSLHLAMACAQAAEARIRRGAGGEALGLLQRGRLSLERRLAQDASVPVLRQLVEGLTMEAQLLCLAEQGETAVAAAQRAWQVNRRLLAESGQLDDVLRQVATERLLVRALAVAQRLPEGLPHMRAAVHLCEAVGDALTQPDQVEMHADVLADAAFFVQRLDRHGESLHYGDAALRAYEAVPSSREMRLKLLVARGECRLALGQWTGALDATDEGLALAANGTPDDLDRLYSVRVVARLALGHTGEALKECRAAEGRVGDRQAIATSDEARAAAATALLDLTVLHARVAMQIGAVAEALDAFTEAVRQDVDQTFAASRQTLCRKLLDASADDIPALLALARERMGEGYGRFQAALPHDATDTAPRNLLVDALYLGAEAWLLADRAHGLHAARPFLSRLGTRREPEVPIRRAQAAHLRLQAALHLGWNGAARLWAADAWHAALEAHDLAPADIAPLLVDAAGALHALALDGQPAPNTPPLPGVVKAARERIQRAPATAAWRGPLLDRLAAMGRT